MPVCHGMFTLYVHCEGAQTNAPPSTTPRLWIGDSKTVTLPLANALRLNYPAQTSGSAGVHFGHECTPHGSAPHI